MSSKVTKNEIIDSIYKNGKIERQDIQYVIDAFLESVKESLEAGSVIELRGFGTFETRLRKGREEARNPKTGEKVSVDSHYVVAFRSGKELKDSVWSLDKKENESK